MTSASVLGRRRSASGWCAVAAMGVLDELTTSLLDHVGPGRRFELKTVRRQRRVGIKLVEGQQRALPEAVQYLKRHQLTCFIRGRNLETDTNCLQLPIFGFGCSSDPLQAVF